MVIRGQRGGRHPWPERLQLFSSQLFNVGVQEGELREGCWEGSVVGIGNLGGRAGWRADNVLCSEYPADNEMSSRDPSTSEPSEKTSS